MKNELKEKSFKNITNYCDFNIEYNKSLNFSKQLSNCYGDSNQRNVEKIEKQHAISKVAETFLFTYLDSIIPNQYNPPDFEIYMSRQKSWDCDLMPNKNVEGFHNYPIEVKTFNTETFSSGSLKNKFSYTLQCSKNRKDKKFFDPNYNDLFYMYLMFVDTKEEEVFIYDSLRSDDPKLDLSSDKCIFKDPILPHLKGYKKCIYISDLL